MQMQPSKLVSNIPSFIQKYHVDTIFTFILQNKEIKRFEGANFVKALTT
jgi:hypothetical protein